MPSWWDVYEIESRGLNFSLEVALELVLWLFASLYSFLGLRHPSGHSWGCFAIFFSSPKVFSQVSTPASFMTFG